MSERLQGIDAFVQAVEAGSFAQAAERMRLTRSAVGKSIARLERRLGVRLFHRTTRRQSLTEDGQAYYERCKRALAELEDAEAALDNGRREPSGRLRVSVPVLFGRHCVAPVLTRLARQYPRLEVEIAFSDRVVDLLEEGFDLAVRVGDLRDSSTLAARRLGTQHLAICAAPSYLDAHGWPRTIEELSHVMHRGIHSRFGNVAGAGDDVDDLQARFGHLHEFAYLEVSKLDGSVVALQSDVSEGSALRQASSDRRCIDGIDVDVVASENRIVEAEGEGRPTDRLVGTQAAHDDVDAHRSAHDRVL